MRHLRHTVLATLVFGLCAAPIAGAHPHEHGGRAVVAPARGGGLTGGELLGEVWARGLVQPDGEKDPFTGSCATLARNVVTPHTDADAATCTVRPATRVFFSYGTECSNVEGPFDTEEEQLACAVASDQAIREINVTVDNRDAIDLVRPRFELFSPQRTVELPADNVLHLPARTATFTAHGWGAVIRRLRPGRHTVVIEVRAPDWGVTFTDTLTLTVLPRGHGGDADHGDRVGDHHG